MTVEGASGIGVPVAPGMMRRMACFTYESVLLFGVLMCAGLLFSTLTQQRHALVGRLALQGFVFIVLGLYFTWFWSHGGQTVAMKAWHIRLVGPKGEAVSWLRAMLRYVLSWLWFLPSLATSYLSDIHSPSAIFGVCVVGMVGYTALARLHPQRQFWHDVVCGTRLVTVRATRTV